MSRIGNEPVKIVEKVTVTVNDNIVKVTGPKGELSLTIPSDITVELKDNEIIVKRENDRVKTKMLHGTIRSLINNMIIGVTQGFEKELEIQGVGYKVELKGNQLALYLGYNHPLYIDIPEDIKIEVPSQTEIKISGISKQRVGQFASYIRGLKKPDVYKGKGIRYKGEQVRKKEVKVGI